MTHNRQTGPNTFVAEPFEGVGGQTPTHSEWVQRALAAPTLKASMADRVKPKHPAKRPTPPPPKPPVAAPTPVLPVVVHVPDFAPPKDMAEAKQRRDAVRNKVNVLNASMVGLLKKSPARTSVHQALADAAIEVRAIKQWMHANRDKTDNGLADTYTVDLMRALVDAMDRVIEEGAMFTNDERDAMDKAASWLSKFEEWEE